MRLRNSAATPRTRMILSRHMGPRLEVVRRWQPSLTMAPPGIRIRRSPPFVFAASGQAALSRTVSGTGSGLLAEPSIDSTVMKIMSWSPRFSRS